MGFFMDIVRPYGVEFKSYTDFYAALGYTRSQGKKYIDQYFNGDIEACVRKRLGMLDENAIKIRLLELRNKVTGRDDPIPNIEAPLSPNIEAVDREVLSVLKASYRMLDDAQRRTIIDTTAIAFNMSAAELMRAVESVFMTKSDSSDSDTAHQDEN